MTTTFKFWTVFVTGENDYLMLSSMPSNILGLIHLHTKPVPLASGDEGAHDSRVDIYSQDLTRGRCRFCVKKFRVNKGIHFYRVCFSKYCESESLIAYNTCFVPALFVQEKKGFFDVYLTRCGPNRHVNAYITFSL